jgi:hypothetical protein
MSLSILMLSAAVLLSSNSSSSTRHFVPVPISRFPRAIFVREFCEGTPAEVKQCWASFRDHGAVWAADIDGDHVDELIVEPSGGWAGSAGPWYFLYRRQGTDWISAEREHPKDKKDEVGWQTRDPRFDVLPVERSGHHDLRVVIDECMKWDGAKYVWYEPEDYRHLSPAWFDATDNREAEIFWMIRYAGQRTINFEPQSFPLTRDDFVTLQGPAPRVQVAHSRVIAVSLDDPEENVRWVGVAKGGVWGISGERVFFLAPQLSETFEGIVSLRLEGDWLLAYGTVVSDSEKSEVPGERVRPSIRYNRRTHELKIEPHDYEEPHD